MLFNYLIRVSYKAAINRNVFSDFKQALDQFLRLYKCCIKSVIYADAAGNTAQALVIPLNICCVGLVGFFPAKGHSNLMTIT